MKTQQVNAAVDELRESIRRLDSDLPPHMARLEKSTQAVVDEAERLARVARGSSSQLKAIRPPFPSPTEKAPRAKEPVPSLTGRFAALRG